MRDIRKMDRRFLIDYAAFALRGLALVTLHDIDTAHDRALFGAAHFQNLALLALVSAGDDDDLIALFDFCSHYSTSGASEMIFIWFLARSSRGTGPKIRVPIGSFWLLIRTAALVSKRITEPSARLMSVAVRTTT